MLDLPQLLRVQLPFVRLLSVRLPTSPYCHWLHLRPPRLGRRDSRTRDATRTPGPLPCSPAPTGAAGGLPSAIVALVLIFAQKILLNGLQEVCCLRHLIRPWGQAWQRAAGKRVPTTVQTCNVCCGGSRLFLGGFTSEKEAPGRIAKVEGGDLKPS